MIYTPAEDSFLLEKEVFKRAKGKAVLDMGAGSGILAMAASRSKAKAVLAADINPEVVVELKNKGINVIQSNLFDNINGKFDLIICNPPYLPEDEREDQESSLITSGGKEGDEFLLSFIEQAASHLNTSGEILIVLSSLTPKNRIEKLLQTLKLKRTVLADQKVSFEILEVWLIKGK
jgi:release factor glutamine methyltransferase